MNGSYETVGISGFGSLKPRVEYRLNINGNTFSLTKEPEGFQDKTLVIFKGDTMERYKANIEALKEQLERFLLGQEKK